MNEYRRMKRVIKRKVRETAGGRTKKRWAERVRGERFVSRMGEEEASDGKRIMYENNFHDVGPFLLRL